MTDKRNPRRMLIKSVLAGLVAVPAATLLREAQAGAPAALVPLGVAEPTAKALGYVEDTTKVDAKAAPTHKVEQRCSTCVQYQGKAGDARGGCNLFPGKSVTAGGWCKVWALKPGSAA